MNIPESKKIHSALISVYHKDGLDRILELLARHQVHMISTGGTYEYLVSKGYQAVRVEDLTGYPSVLGGRVKTLHPVIFGGILGRSDYLQDQLDMNRFQIQPIDLVIVDLYPFEETLTQTENENELIEKIDIGGISLIRAAAKNFREVMVVPSRQLFDHFAELYEKHQGFTTLEQRQWFAAQAFNISSHYDTLIFEWFNQKAGIRVFKKSILQVYPLRYGENPHQEGIFYGDPGKMFEQLSGKALSYNNLGDVEAAMRLINEFSETAVAIIKHQNPCGVSTGDNLVEAWQKALAADPVSAFGGVIITNRTVDLATARLMHELFFEVLIASDFQPEALELLTQKKNRIILRRKTSALPDREFRSLGYGVLEQQSDYYQENPETFRCVTLLEPSANEREDLWFGLRVVKHAKSNAITLVKNRQLIGIGSGQTSRVEAVRQAIEKARSQGFDIRGAVMASDAFFPFADSVKLACEAGVRSVIQPGGSLRDQESIDFCNQHQMSMLLTGIRHFKH